MRLQLSGNIPVCFGLGFLVKCLFQREGNSSLLPVCGFGPTLPKETLRAAALEPCREERSVPQLCCAHGTRLPSQQPPSWQVQIKAVSTQNWFILVKCCRKQLENNPLKFCLVPVAA